MEGSKFFMRCKGCGRGLTGEPNFSDYCKICSANRINSQIDIIVLEDLERQGYFEEEIPNGLFEV